MTPEFSFSNCTDLVKELGPGWVWSLAVGGETSGGQKGASLLQKGPLVLSQSTAFIALMLGTLRPRAEGTCQGHLVVPPIAVKSSGLWLQPAWIQILALPLFSSGTGGNITSLNLHFLHQ